MKDLIKDLKFIITASNDCEKDNRIEQLILDYIKQVETEKQLSIHGVIGSLPIQNLPNCTRVEVIDQKGRSYVNWKPTNKVRLSMQDEGRTAKIFID